MPWAGGGAEILGQKLLGTLGSSDPVRFRNAALIDNKVTYLLCRDIIAVIGVCYIVFLFRPVGPVRRQRMCWEIIRALSGIVIPIVANKYAFEVVFELVLYGRGLIRPLRGFT